MSPDAASAGYSGTPQSRKLGLKPGMRVALDAAPDAWAFDDPPPGLLEAEPDAPADLVLAFVREAAGLSDALPALGRRVFPNGCVWVAWPRRTAGHVSDVTDDLIRDTALELGLVDVKVAALSEDWSALKLVWRLENRHT